MQPRVRSTAGEMRSPLEIVAFLRNHETTSHCDLTVHQKSLDEKVTKQNGEARTWRSTDRRIANWASELAVISNYTLIFSSRAK